MASGADTLANTLLPSLIAGKTFNFPVVDLSNALFAQPVASGVFYENPSLLEVTNLTTGSVGGDGVFDKVMSSLKAHLKEEYNANRITGAEYTKAYTNTVSTALQIAVQFLLGRDQAHWQAMLLQQQAKIAQTEAVKARVELETARFMNVRASYEAATLEASYAVTKIKLASEDAAYGNLLAQGVGITYTNTYILPEQKALLGEQVEVQRAQTVDTRRDAGTVTGTLGKQKDLYSQQITSYQRDAETKVAKMFTDSWITQKTIDEGLLAPTNFSNTTLDTVLSKLRTNTGLT